MLQLGLVFVLALAAGAARAAQPKQADFRVATLTKD